MSEPRTIPAPAATDNPTFTILLGGQELSSEHHVVSLVVIKQVNRIAAAKLSLLDGDPASENFNLSSSDLFLPGQEIEIQAGYHSQNSSLFKGIIVRHAIKVRSGKPSLLSVECKHAAVKMIAVRSSAYFNDSLDSNIGEQLLERHGLEGEIEATRVTHPGMVQFAASDWDFLVMRAEANGQLVFTNDGQVKLAQPDFSREPVLAPLFGATVLELDAEMDSRDQPPAVTGQSWDIAGQELLEVEGGEPQPAAPGDVSAGQLAQVAGDDTVILRHAGMRSEDELQAWADAQLLKSRLAKVRGRIKFTGFAGINPGDLIELGGLGGRFNGKAYVSGVRHEIGGGLWTTDAQFGLEPEWFCQGREVSPPPAAGLLPAVAGLQQGVVLQLEGDPAGEHRVLVRMPMVAAGEEGIWARVATLDAGSERGSFFRPEIGDEVMLGFVNDDPRDPVILGMLNSSALPAPLAASDANPEKGFISRSGIQLIFNDEKKSVLLQTPAGKLVSLDEEAGLVTLADENGNKIEMGAEGIAIESAGKITLKATGDLELEGANAKIKASAQFKAEGAAGAEVSSSATAVLKGALVQIN